MPEQDPDLMCKTSDSRPCVAVSNSKNMCSKDASIRGSNFPLPENALILRLVKHGNVQDMARHETDLSNIQIESRTVEKRMKQTSRGTAVRTQSGKTGAEMMHDIDWASYPGSTRHQTCWQ